MVNIEDPDQTASCDLVVHCLPRHICPKTKDQFNAVHYKRIMIFLFYFTV